MLKKIINTNFKKWLFCIPLLLISHSLLTANTTNQWSNSHPNSQTTLSKSASSNQHDPNLDEPVVYHINEHNVHINRQWAKWLDARGKNSSNGYNQFIGDIGKFVIDISQQTFQNQNLINQTLFEFELLGIDTTINLPQPCQIKTPNFGISNIGGFCPSYQEYDKFGENNKIKIEGKQLSSTSYSSIKFFSHKFEWYWGWFMAEFTLKVKLSNDLKSLLFNFHYDVQSYSGATAVDWGSKGVVGFRIKRLKIIPRNITKIQDVSNILQSLIKELTTKLQATDFDKNDHDLGELINKINGFYKTYQQLKNTQNSNIMADSPTDHSELLKTYKKIVNSQKPPLTPPPPNQKNNPPLKILSTLPSHLLQYADFSKTEKGVYWGFTGISFTLFISLLYGIQRILKIDILRYGQKKYYFLGLTVIAALLTSLAGSYLLASLLTSL